MPCEAKGHEDVVHILRKGFNIVVPEIDISYFFKNFLLMSPVTNVVSLLRVFAIFLLDLNQIDTLRDDI